MTVKAQSRPYSFKFFKGCLLQTLLGPFLNTFSHMFRKSLWLGEDNVSPLSPVKENELVQPIKYIWSCLQVRQNKWYKTKELLSSVAKKILINKISKISTHQINSILISAIFKQTGFIWIDHFCCFS